MRNEIRLGWEVRSQAGATRATYEEIYWATQPFSAAATRSLCYLYLNTDVLVMRIVRSKNSTWSGEGRFRAERHPSVSTAAADLAGRPKWNGISHTCTSRMSISTAERRRGFERGRRRATHRARREWTTTWWSCYRSDSGRETPPCTRTSPGRNRWCLRDWAKPGQVAIRPQLGTHVPCIHPARVRGSYRTRCKLISFSPAAKSA